MIKSMRMRHIVLAMMLSGVVLTAPACGGGAGGSDLSCGPSTLETPTAVLNTAGVGQWTLVLTQAKSSCSSAPDSITCLLDMVVNGNDVDVSGTCQSNTGVTVALDDISGKVSADTLYWGATMSATVGDYSETDTVPCTGVAFVSSTESETFAVTVSVSFNNAGTEGTCSTSFSGKFQ